MGGNRRSWRSYPVGALLFFAVLALCPVPFGSTSLRMMSLWIAVMGAALAFSRANVLRWVHGVVLTYVTLLVIVFALVVHEQTSQTPWFASVHPVWAQASAAMAAPLPGVAAVSATQPYLSVGAALANILALLCGLVIGSDRRRARQVVCTVAIAGAVIALFGIVSHLVAPTTLLWREKEAYLASVTGTFTNRNTAATYFGSCTLIWLLLLCEQVEAKIPSGVSGRELRHLLFDRFHRDIFVHLGLMLLCAAALFMTLSRAGVVLSLVVSAAASVVFLQRHVSTRWGRLIVVGCVAGVGFVLLQVMGAGVTARFQYEGAGEIGRIEAYKSALRMIADYPAWGVGLGAFELAFPPYRSVELGIFGVWDKAHSTPLEIAAEGGVSLLIAIMIGWIAALAVLTHGVIIRRRDRIIPLIAAGVCILASFHSAIDFSLQIPGYSIVVFGLLGTGLAQSLPRLKTVPDRRRRSTDTIILNKSI